MEKIELYPGMDLDKAIEILLEAKKAGVSVYCEFNGHKLYSNNVTIDSAYLEVTGETKAEFERKLQQQREEYKREEEIAKKAALEKVPEWIKQGEQYIYPQKQKEWEKCVKARVKDLYNGYEIDCALKVMEALSNGTSYEEVNNMIYEQNHSGTSYGILMNIVLNFYKNAPCSRLSVCYFDRST